MNSRIVTRIMLAGVFAAAFALVAVPAHAQLGSVHGKVVDEAGNPVPDADISYDLGGGEQNLHFKGKTDSKGEYNRGGLQLGHGLWSITVTKGNLVGGVKNIDIPEGNALQMPNITIRAAEAAGNAKAIADLNKVLSDVKALVAENNFDGAVTELTAEITQQPKCGACYVRLGDTYYAKSNAGTNADQKKVDLDNAEKAYQQAIAINDKSQDAADAYGGLTALYNKELRFDDAGKANQKQAEIQAASAPAGGAPGAGGGDATAAYNSGVLLWNQSKMTEAEAQFTKAIQLKPDMAEAHYYLGMCLINEGKMDDAKKSLTEYLRLAPNGPNAATAKSVLDTMK